ncbi:GNAT family N-acetyltransferase [Nocardiopsis sp. HNM0947]|uniref:GNAT family N-acetyltransferase n=1 Tax=Nocardiopsis coralli TaxID=2772213 RepID=A0ABR9PAJ4_9ACTN|nr:GNAT family N-acetyltransferase [Nocardiopsis coralli]MBE3000858.1 GNAT family N-acetyltransferase [Nocardiopsis coralli]
MTGIEHDPTIRPLHGTQELELFNRLPFVLNHEFAVDLDEGRRRTDWMWVALDGDRILARLAFWRRRREDPTPFLLDVLDVDDTDEDLDRVAVLTDLLRAAGAEVLGPDGSWPEYLRFVDAGWRDLPGTRRAVDERMEAVARVGGVPFVERLRYRWRAADTPVPSGSGRLRFRGIRDEAEILSLMARALEGTLDGHDRADLAGASPEQVARANFDEEFARYATPRSWWRIATLDGGEPVGFVVPGRNAKHPIIGYIAVLPEHRGHGYIDDLLAEGTRVLAEEGGETYAHAATDLGNVPMARAFDRAGYTTVSGVVSMVWP